MNLLHYNPLIAYESRSLFGSVLHDPVTAIVVTGAVVAGAGALQSGRSQASNLRSQANADLYNKQIDDQNAAQTEQTGTQKELAVDRNNALQMGESRAAIGEANIGGPQGGTASLALEQDSVNGELNALGQRYDRDTQAAAYTDKGNLEGYDANIAENNARAAIAASKVSAVSALLGGANKGFAQQTQLDNASVPVNSSGLDAGDRQFQSNYRNSGAQF